MSKRELKRYLIPLRKAFYLVGENIQMTLLKAEVQEKNEKTNLHQEKNEKKTDMKRVKRGGSSIQCIKDAWKKGSLI